MHKVGNKIEFNEYSLESVYLVGKHISNQAGQKYVTKWYSSWRRAKIVQSNSFLLHRSQSAIPVYITELLLLKKAINPLNAELNPICYLLALLAHHFLHVSRIRITSLTLRLLMSYIYIYIYIHICVCVCVCVWSTHS